MSTLPTAFQRNIVVRALGERGAQEFYEQYQNASHRRVQKEPTEKEIRLANLARENGYRLAAQKAGVQIEFVYSAVNKVARYRFLNAQ